MARMIVRKNEGIMCNRNARICSPSVPCSNESRAKRLINPMAKILSMRGRRGRSFMYD
jgi:hypothetical protein